MKKMLSVILILMLLGSVALAETNLTPDAYLASRGLIVLDEDTLKSMGADMGNNDIINIQYCGFGATGDQQTIIVRTNKLYIAIEAAAMFGNGTMDNKAFAGIFSDLCKNFEFECYSVTLEDGTSIAYFPDKSLIDQLPEDADMSDTTLIDSFDEFMAMVENIE